MKYGEKLTSSELNTLLNSWPVNTIGHNKEGRIIVALEVFGREIGYGALAQLAQFIREIQCDGSPENAIVMKEQRFPAMGWALPEGFASLVSRLRS